MKDRQKVQFISVIALLTITSLFIFADKANAAEYEIGKFVTCEAVQNNVPVGEKTTFNIAHDDGFNAYIRFARICGEEGEEVKYKLTITTPDNEIIEGEEKTVYISGGCWFNELFWMYQGGLMLGEYTIDLYIDGEVAETLTITIIGENSYIVGQFVACDSVNAQNQPVGIGTNYNIRTDVGFFVFVFMAEACGTITAQVVITRPDETKFYGHEEIIVTDGPCWQNIPFWDFHNSLILGRYQVDLVVNGVVDQTIYVDVNGAKYTLNRFVTAKDVVDSEPVGVTETFSIQSESGFFPYVDFTDVCAPMTAQFRITDPDEVVTLGHVETYDPESGCWTELKTWDYYHYYLTGQYKIELLVDDEVAETKYINVVGEDTYIVDQFVTCEGMIGTHPMGIMTKFNLQEHNSFYIFVKLQEACGNISVQFKVKSPDDSEPVVAYEGTVDTGGSCWADISMWSLYNIFTIGDYQVELVLNSVIVRTINVKVAKSKTNLVPVYQLLLLNEE